MSTKIALSAELRKLIENRLEQTLKGIEATLIEITKNQILNPKTLQEELTSLEATFDVLFQKWNLKILYTLFLKETIGFGELKNALNVNSRTLSDKLKTLQNHSYIERNVQNGPPLRVEYKLTEKGKNTVLLAVPLLYYAVTDDQPQQSTPDA